MKVLLGDSSNNDKNFSFEQLKFHHLAKILFFPFIIWLAYIANYIDIVAFVHSQIFYGIAVVKKYSKDNNFIQIPSFILLFLLGNLLLFHKILGFGNYPLTKTVVSNNAAPYSVWFNKDSIIVGLSLIIIFYKPKPFVTQDFIRMLYITICGVIFMSVIALSLGSVKVDIKYVSFFWLWLVFTFISVVVEEAFFRLFLLESIIRLYKGKYNSVLAVIFVSIVFALKHYYGNIGYASLAFIGSLIYSYVYIMCGRRLEASVFCHLSINVMHMIFFTYPFLRGGL